MTRPIKFRAWDKEKNEMRLVLNCDFINRDSTLYSRWGELMQFTGLLDRHGKEIYEGDIVELRTGDLCDCAECNNSFKPPRRIVKYSHLSFSVNPHGGDTAVKVIGNIYENPELLTPSDHETT